jgi:hypothetical protein
MKFAIHSSFELATAEYGKILVVVLNSPIHIGNIQVPALYVSTTIANEGSIDNGNVIDLPNCPIDIQPLSDGTWVAVIDRQ